MRSLPRVSLLVVALLVAGCASPAGEIDLGTGERAPEGAPDSPTASPTPGTPGAPPKDAPPPDDGKDAPPKDDPPPPEKERTFCKEEAGCDFWDDEYHQYTLYEVDTLHLDVLIVPSASPGANADTAVIEQAVAAWHAGIRQLAAPWLAEGLTMQVYVLGRDAPPQDAIEDPEILVLAAEYNPFLLFGIGYQTPPTPCRGEALRSYAPHEHGGMRVLAAECAEGGYSCLAINTNDLGAGTYSLHDLVAHEFGHCLGAGHVGDALDFRAKRVPVRDIMSYQSDEEQVHCVSNLNVRVLEGLYAPVAGVEVATPLEPGDFYPMLPAAYRQVVCENPA